MAWGRGCESDRGQLRQRLAFLGSGMRASLDLLGSWLFSPSKLTDRLADPRRAGLPRCSACQRNCWRVSRDVPVLVRGVVESGAEPVGYRQAQGRDPGRITRISTPPRAYRRRIRLRYPLVRPPHRVSESRTGHEQDRHYHVILRHYPSS